MLLPAGVDDRARPSGGNVYDRRIIAGLAERGWRVHEHVAGPGVVAGLPDGAVVLVDGLVASPELVRAAERLRVVVLVHMPRGPRDRDERTVLTTAAGVVTTSRWTRRRLLGWYRLDPDRVRVAEPGVDRADPAAGTYEGRSLLCVGAVTTVKGHDVLVAALGLVADLEWTCRCVGSLEIEPDLAAVVREKADRVELAGPLTGPELEAAYAGADLLVLPSRTETYGMVVTEALARGIPVVASDTGGVREAMGHGAGVLIAPGDPVALGDALRRWLTDARHRAVLRVGARARRDQLHGWELTSSLVAGALAEVVS
jgi:glycosyltransferase involved in cell wall biosynthesis